MIPLYMKENNIGGKGGWSNW